MRRLLVAGAVVAAAAGSVVLAGTAGADPIATCTPTVGTVVAVDFARWGGPIVRGCGVGAATGFALLGDAGFTSVGDQHDGPSFVCRLGNEAFAGGTLYPTPKQDRCIVTPPASAYWSYWVAPAGQHTWRYATTGAAGDVPAPGEVELWNFGGTDLGGASGSGVPTVSPDVLRAQAVVGSTAPVSSATSVQPTATAPAPARRGATGAPHTTATGVRTSSAAPTGPTPCATPGGCSRSTSSGSAVRPSAAGASVDGRATSPAGSPSPVVVDALPASHVAADHGSVLPVVAVGGVVGLLAVGGGAAAWRRRRSGQV